jgi:hypothetical protein
MGGGMAGEWAVGAMARVRPVVDFFHGAEKWLTMFFANVLTIMVGSFIGFMGTDRDVARTPLEQGLWAAAGGMWLVLDVPYLWRVWRVAFEGRGGEAVPFALEVARRQRVWPVVLRPVVAVWWLGHFAVGATFAVMSHSLESLAGMNALAFLLVTSYGFAANGYLMLGVCALTRSERVRERVWRMRGVVDIGLGVVGAFVPVGKFMET